MTLPGQVRRVHVIGTGATSSRIWGDTDFLKKFLPAVAARAATVAASQTKNVKAHRRSLYPGDPGFAVSASSRTSLNKVPSKGGGSLPGRSFRLARLRGDGSPDPDATHQFTYQGSFTNLRANIDAGSTAPLILYSHTGRPHYLNAAAS